MPKTLEELTAMMTEQGQDVPNFLSDPDVEVDDELIEQLVTDHGLVLEDDNDGTDGGGEDDDDEEIVTMTKDELNALSKKQIGRGRRRAHKDAAAKFAKEYGMTIDEARAALEAASDGNTKPPAAPPEPTGEDGASEERKAIAAERAALRAERAEMRNQQTRSKAIQALATAGASSPQRAVKLLDLEGLAHDSDDEDFADLVDELSEEMPELFNTATGGSAGKGRSTVTGTGRQSPRNPNPQLTAAERGRLRAAENSKTRAERRSPIERMGNTR